MSDKNRDGKRTARERMLEQRAADEAASKRRKKLIVGGAVLAVIAAAVVTGVVVQNQRSKPETPTAAPAGTIGDKNLVIPVGAANAPSVLTVYEDPRCPACGIFEREFAATIDQLEDAGKIYTNAHIVSFIDRAVPGKGSKNGANALACAQDAGHFRDFHDVLYRNQPDETSDAFGDKAVLLNLAKQVNGLDTPEFQACVNDNKFGGWVSAVQQDFDKSSYKSTPTVLLNGQPIYPKNGNDEISPANLVKWVDAANQGKQLGTAGSHGQSPAPTSTASEANNPSPSAG
ncbi:thioredoxin domain-containing protein [Streptomyces rubellomurinus]|uniref:Membrane protein n=2 Tax=Streptomyces TaxID=1883 RepID=A0A0F2T9T1_STRR3|nr:thioredoxin domain-containing protein [Streptomyces rubellomurinus]KJS54952.1 membrane protein [Streptomyces rubellomurinus subsp. indigoferus]KJS59201.1 membrane protein [Streptomyces rubellomurinus]